MRINLLTCIMALPFSGIIQKMTSYFSYFFQKKKKKIDILCKLSPLEAFCMKCQILGK